MKKIVGMLLLCTIFFNAIAQKNSYSITGKILDSKTNEAIAFATVKCNDKIVASNADGKFSLPQTFANGVYLLKITSIGYDALSYKVKVNNKNVDDVTIKLQPSFMELQSLEVNALRANDKAPFTKTNLSKQEIEKLNVGQDLPFLLNQTPSVVVNSDAGNGVGYTGIKIRGSDATRVNVTLNGIPFNDAESHATYFVDLPDFASSASSIQIQRGVGTSTNGTGAFGATINVQTNQTNKEAYAEANNGYGSFNTFKNTVKVGSGLINNHYTIDARLSNITSDGYIDRATSKLQSYAISAGYLNNNSSLKFNIFSGKEKTYQAWNGVSEAKLQTNPTYNLSGTEKPGTPYDNETDSYNQTHYQLFYNRTISQSLAYNLAAFYTRGLGYYENYKADEKYTNYGITSATQSNTDLIRQQWLDNHFYGQLFSVQYKKDDAVLTVGGGWSEYKGKHIGKIIWAQNGSVQPGYEYYKLNALKIDNNIYAKYQKAIAKNLDAFVDMQYRFVNHKMDGFKGNPTLYVMRKFSFFNPKAGLTYTRNNWQAYLSYAMANKEPNRDDFEAELAAQPTHETLHDFELGIEKKTKKLYVNATVYYMHYKNQLVLTGKINDVGAYTRTNVDNSYRAGIELQLGYKFTNWLHATTNFTYSQNKIKEFVEYVDNYDTYLQETVKHTNTNIAFSPSAVGGYQLNFIAHENINFMVAGKYVGKQYLDNTQNEAKKLDGFYTQDLKASFKIKNSLFKATIVMLSVNNIFNKKYQPSGYTFSYIYGGNLTTENYYYPMAGTNFMVNLNVKF